MKGKCLLVSIILAVVLPVSGGENNLSISMRLSLEKALSSTNVFNKSYEFTIDSISKPLADLAANELLSWFFHRPSESERDEVAWGEVKNRVMLLNGEISGLSENLNIVKIKLDSLECSLLEDSSNTAILTINRNIKEFNSYFEKLENGISEPKDLITWAQKGRSDLKNAVNQIDIALRGARSIESCRTAYGEEGITYLIGNAVGLASQAQLVITNMYSILAKNEDVKNGMLETTCATKRSKEYCNASIVAFKNIRELQVGWLTLVGFPQTLADEIITEPRTITGSSEV